MIRKVLLWTCDHCQATAVEPTTWERGRGREYCDGDACIASRMEARSAREVYEASVAEARARYERDEAKARAKLEPPPE